MFVLFFACADILKERDEQIKQSLTEKLQIFAALYEVVTGQETPNRGLLLRGDATDLQQGATLLKGAIDEGRSWRISSFYSLQLTMNEFGLIMQYSKLNRVIFKFWRNTLK